MNRKSLITGLTTMVGFIIGFYLHKIFMYTMLGLAAGYLVVYWVPQLMADHKEKSKRKTTKK